MTGDVDLPDAVIFDGHCVLCARFFRFVLRYDRAARFHFAVVQSPLGREVYAAQGLPDDPADTFLVICDGQVFQKLDGVCVVLGQLGWPWRIAAVLRVLPAGVKGWLYDRVAQNRYRVFGRSAQCLVPTPEIISRFLPRGLP